MNYTSIGNFGSCNVNPTSNPLSYCATSGLESGFMHTIGGGNGLVGPNSSQCQRFMGSYCANNWDGICESMSEDNDRRFPNTVQSCNISVGYIGNGLNNTLTKGQILLRNTAAEKYLNAMSANCQRTYESFDPTTADSPLISNWIPMTGECSTSNGNCLAQSTSCTPIYAVNPKQINNDPVMNKILEQPWIAIDILANIYTNAKNSKKLEELRGTKLYVFFLSDSFQRIIKS